ncbi:DUF262 domain-containing protein [Flavisolibacter sp. BT320]|nr:DUF262 domain-containing protein [Flavisolibacter longurius]
MPLVLFKELMKYKITKWTIKKLYETYKKSQLNLNPPYQRNFIWTIADQQYLIGSLKKRNPIPNFFLLEKPEGKYEMVDGQQRSRTMISYIDKQFADLEGSLFDKKKHAQFLKYEFPVTIISDTEGESIEKFYAIVNKTGVHLNKPEVRKADFYNTNYLKLVNEITNSKDFSKLHIFTDKSLKRMNDIEYVAELVILIKDGHVDKKENMDEYFKNDLSIDECSNIKRKFSNVLGKINMLNQVYRISNSRYKQKNDFYTLFDFILNNDNVDLATLQYFYKILILIGKDIKPTQDKCEPLREYARNCVTQSNSKLARENRLYFFQKLFLNKNSKPNAIQSNVLRFYGLKSDDLKTIDGFHTISLQKLSAQKPTIEFEL